MALAGCLQNSAERAPYMHSYRRLGADLDRELCWRMGWESKPLVKTLDARRPGIVRCGLFFFPFPVLRFQRLVVRLFRFVSTM